MPVHDTKSVSETIAPETDQQKRTDAYFDAEAAHWNDLYSQENTNSVVYKDRRTMVLSMARGLSLPVDSPILEIGCGAGFTSVALAEDGYTIHAVDSVDAMIARTRQHAEEAGVGRQVITSIQDVHNLGFPDRTFSLVLKIGVAPWVHSVDKAMCEVARVLRPGGYLIATADNWWRLHFWLDPRFFPPLGPIRRGGRRVMELVGLLPPKEPSARLHSIREFDACIAAAGLEKIEGKTVGFGPFSFLGRTILPEPQGVRLHHWLQGHADRGVPGIRAAGSHYVVLAMKAGTH
jgi:SAM-dependent methyltransferase